MFPPLAWAASPSRRMRSEEHGRDLRTVEEQIRRITKILRQLLDFARPGTGQGGLVERGEGTGLGLAVSYRLVEQLGGRIGIESAPGQGTVVTVSLRLAEAQAAGQTL